MQDSGQTAEAADRARVRDVLRRCSVLASERERVAFDARSLEQDLSRLLQGGNVEQHRPVLDLPQARSALAGEGKAMQTLVAGTAIQTLSRHADKL